MSSFFYQIGSITTTNEWVRPSYEVVSEFFKNSQVLEIAKKYNILICGGFLYRKLTWDLDLCLILDYNEETDWIKVENDLNILYDIALNKHSLLLDACVTKERYHIPTKHELISYNKDTDIEDWQFPRKQRDAIMKLGRFKKIVNGRVQFDIDIIESFNPEYGRVSRLTNGYLYETDRSGISCPLKLIKLVMKTIDRPNDRLFLPYLEFINMPKQKYLDSIILINETIR